MAIRIWFTLLNNLFRNADLTGLTPNFVALCHTVRKDKLTDFMMFWRFIYLATVFKPAYLVMLLPGNVAMNEYKTKLARVLLREDAISTH